MALTRSQRTVLEMLATRDRATPRSLGVRRDVLLRLVEKGLVGQDAHGAFYLTTAGRQEGWAASESDACAVCADRDDVQDVEVPDPGDPDNYFITEPRCREHRRTLSSGVM